MKLVPFVSGDPIPDDIKCASVEARDRVLRSRILAKLRSDEAAVHLQDVDPDTGEVIILTKQDFKDECDLNLLMQRYTPQMLIESYNASMGVYGDYSDVMSHQDARERVMLTQSWFESLPAKMRSMFDHDVSKCVEYLENPSNTDEAIQLGLLKKPLSDKDSKPEIVPPDVSLDVTGGTDTASVS